MEEALSLKKQMNISRKMTHLVRGEERGSETNKTKQKRHKGKRKEIKMHAVFYWHCAVKELYLNLSTNCRQEDCQYLQLCDTHPPSDTTPGCVSESAAWLLSATHTVVPRAIIHINEWYCCHSDTCSIAVCLLLLLILTPALPRLCAFHLIFQTESNYTCWAVIPFCPSSHIHCDQQPATTATH